MLVHKCDRCKKETNRDDITSLDAFQDNKAYELCPECYKAFKDKFLHELDKVTATQTSGK